MKADRWLADGTLVFTGRNINGLLAASRRRTNLVRERNVSVTSQEGKKKLSLR